MKERHLRNQLDDVTLGEEREDVLLRAMEGETPEPHRVDHGEPAVLALNYYTIGGVAAMRRVQRGGA